MKKLAWKMRKSYGWSPASSRTYSFADDLSDFRAPFHEIVSFSCKGPYRGSMQCMPEEISDLQGL